MRRTRNKSKMIIFLCMTLLFMGIGYAALQSNLNISGTAKSTGIFGVQITNVLETQDSINNGGVSNKTEEHTTTTATFVTEFNAPGDYVEYKITVENTGTIDAVISAVINDTDNEVDENNRPLYIFTAIDEDNLDVTKYRDELNAGESKEITVKIKFNEKATRFPSKNITFTLTIDATQKAKSNYTSAERIPETDSACFVSFIPGEINYYDTSVPGCSQTSKITIPVDIALPVSILNSASMNTPLCMAFASPLKDLNGLSDDDISDSDFCANIGSQVEQMSTQELYSSMYGAFAIPSYTIGTGQEETITSIGSGSFAAKNIETVSIPTDITEIKDLAFVANLLQTISIPDTVTSIGFGGFIYNQISALDLSKVTNLQTIGKHAFYGNQLSGTLTIPSSVTSIGDSAFSHNQLSGTLTIPSSVTSIGNRAFIDNQVSTLDLSKATSLQAIGESAFSGNQLSGTLTIPSSVTSIGDSAFYGNQLSGTLTIPSSVTSIGDSAFSGNQLSGTLTIPSSVTSIGDGAFVGNQLSSLVFANNSHLQTIEGYAFGNNQLSGTLTIPSSVTSIGDNAFHVNKLSELDLSKAINLETIGSYAFYNNQLSGTLTIPSSVTSIGNSAFQYNQISTLSFANNSHLQTIEGYAFGDNKLSGTLTIPKSVTSIGQFAFSYNQLSSLVFENNSHLQTIETYAFYNNQISGTLTIPSSVTSIGDNAFYRNKINALNIGSGLMSLGGGAFSNNNNIQTINIDMTESTWNSRGLPTSDWYDGNITPTYKSE